MSTHSFPPTPQADKKSRHEALAAKNVQRGLAAKVQDLSATFRKKQRVYMESKFFSQSVIDRVITLLPHAKCFVCLELQGHAIKNQDLLIASGTISLNASEGLSAVDEDIEAAVSASFSLVFQ